MLTLLAALAILTCAVLLAIRLLKKPHVFPSADLIAFARSIARGNLTPQLNVEDDSPQAKSVADAMNAMAESLARTIGQSDQAHAELVAILSGMSDGVIAVDPTQHVLLVNYAAAHLLNFNAVAAQGKPLKQLLPDEAIARAVADSIGTSNRTPIRSGVLNGRHLEITICRFPPTGPAAGNVLLVHDATESVRYLEMRKEFVANVSHELRTPLTAIKGFAETLRDGAVKDPVIADRYLTTIEKHADQLTNLVNDLLEISRIENGDETPQHMPLEIGPVAQRAVELLRPAAMKKDQALTIRIEPNLPQVYGRPDELERAIANLVDNAVKYTPNLGTIDVSVQRRLNFIWIDVRDSGIGIPQNEVPRIFERFYRVDRSRSREMGGTGLGLSIIKHVAQAHGGSVLVSSTPGKGSQFTLRLPLPNGVNNPQPLS